MISYKRLSMGKISTCDNAAMNARIIVHNDFRTYIPRYHCAAKSYTNTW